MWKPIHVVFISTQHIDDVRLTGDADQDGGVVQADHGLLHFVRDDFYQTEETQQTERRVNICSVAPTYCDTFIFGAL